MDLFVTPEQPVRRTLNYANSWVTTCHLLADHCGKHMPALSLHLMHQRRVLAAEVAHFNHGLRRDGGGTVNIANDAASVSRPPQSRDDHVT